MTMDVLNYAGINAKDKTRVEKYFEYVTQWNHPTNEGMQFIYDLPKALYQDIAGKHCLCIGKGRLGYGGSYTTNPIHWTKMWQAQTASR